MTKRATEEGKKRELGKCNRSEGQSTGPSNQLGFCAGDPLYKYMCSIRPDLAPPSPEEWAELVTLSRDGKKADARRNLKALSTQYALGKHSSEWLNFWETPFRLRRKGRPMDLDWLERCADWSDQRQRGRGWRQIARVAFPELYKTSKDDAVGRVRDGVRWFDEKWREVLQAVGAEIEKIWPK